MLELKPQPLATVSPPVPKILQEGTLDLNVAAGGQVDGRVKWTMRYIAIDEGAQVVAA